MLVKQKLMCGMDKHNLTEALHTRMNYWVVGSSLYFQSTWLRCVWVNEHTSLHEHLLSSSCIFGDHCQIWHYDMYVLGFQSNLNRDRSGIFSRMNDICMWLCILFVLVCVGLWTLYTKHTRGSSRWTIQKSHLGPFYTSCVPIANILLLCNFSEITSVMSTLLLERVLTLIYL